jgi:predicted NBD/HSP70 family sugar kinase
MSTLSKRALFWTPRALSIAFIAFLSLFAMDVFDEHLGIWQTALALMVHLLPEFVLVVGLVLAWRREWLGAALNAAAGLLYVTWVVFTSRPVPQATKLIWMLAIAGPAFVIAGLFLANWLKRDDLRTIKG